GRARLHQVHRCIEVEQTRLTTAPRADERQGVARRVLAVRRRIPRHGCELEDACEMANEIGRDVHAECDASRVSRGGERWKNTCDGGGRISDEPGESGVDAVEYGSRRTASGVAPERNAPQGADASGLP